MPAAKCPRCGLSISRHSAFHDEQSAEVMAIAAEHESPLLGYCPSLQDDERYRRLMERR